ncbi:nucleolar and coiled-body phosphoprotein 1-like isoform X2 [Palaemon carinicauda]|uniref:nucleolar and coiled-body phosphoprotein 1-like isoform X2 n=1 Tax=Palaemon carinicauda TaxID=392227 RepID=UPI0035B5CEC1
MPSNCAIHGCNNRYEICIGTGIRFFRFPRDEAVRRDWVSKCKRSEEINTKYAAVCSEHFTEKDFVDDLKSRLLMVKPPTNKRLLKRCAVPSVRLHAGEHSMIPDECGAGAMDATRDPDECIEDKSKKTGCGDERQDINDNHTNVTASSQDSDQEAAAADDTLANGEIQTKDAENSEQKKDSNSSDSVPKESASGSVGEKKEESRESDNDGDGKVEVESPQWDIEAEASEDEGRVSSEDDEDKLVISEGNERGTEESADERSKGETSVPAPKIPSRSPTPKASEKRPAEEDAAVEVPSKRSKTLEDALSLNSLTSVSQIESSISQVRKDLEAMECLLKQKEEEWNNLLSLQKRKEELYVRLVRKRQVLLMKSTPSELDAKGDDETSEEATSNLLFMPQGAYSSFGSPQLPLMMMRQMIAAGSISPHALQSAAQVIPTSENNRGGTIGNGSTNISIIDIHTQNNKPGGEMPRVSMSSEVHSKVSKQLTSGMASMKPILPKPPSTSSSLPGLPPSLSFTATGHGPQGPTVNVQQLIAAHRKENPNTPPIRRAMRGAWRHRYDGDKRSSGRDHDRPPSVSSSSSEADTRTTPSNKNPLALSDPSVSYKDVLLRFAELTQNEKQPGSPQISIFPVGGGESSAKRSESSRESTPANRDQTPPLPPTVPTSSALPSSKTSLEAPSALAKLLLESRNSASGTSKPGVEGTNSQYLTLSALLSGGSTTTVKDKTVAHSQSESRSKKTTSQEEGSGNPKCQGCHRQRAQFVCAGCGNQWYCSRDCQVAAWEEHSEHCSN